MSSKPTDFNDQIKQQSPGAVSAGIDEDLQAVAAARRTKDQQQPQAFEGYNPDDESVGGAYDDAPPPDEPPENAPRGDTDWLGLMEKNQWGKRKPTVGNLALVLEHDDRWHKCLAYSDLSYKIIKRFKPPMAHCEEGEWKEEDSAALRIWSQRQYGFTPGHGDIADAVLTVARGNRFHPIREYLNSLTWDGLIRLPTWLKKALGATDHERYLELVGTRFLIGSVARIFRPGCKMDNVMILEGIQGEGKSTIIRELFGEWFSDTVLPIGDKEAYQIIQGVWGFELGELDSFNKTEVTELKRFFSQQVDRFRPSYGRYVEDFNRQTVFIGSTNQEVYLRDYTGNRRFWPIYCAQLDKAWVKQWRDQLWAEAVHGYRQGDIWWVSRETPEDYEIVVDAQDSRLQRDPWEDLLLDYLNGSYNSYLKSAEILKDCIGLDAAHVQQVHMNRLGPIMNRLGWKGTRRRFPIGKEGRKVQMRVWVRDEDPTISDDEVPL